MLVVWGGDSALTGKICQDWFGKDCVRLVFIDTKNEDDDTYRFKKDCEAWYGAEIECISNPRWDCIDDVWDHYNSLNVATGAICSTELKRIVRQDFQNKNNYSYQAFGFDAKEVGRARMMADNYPDSRPIFPLIYKLMGKGESLKVLQKNGLLVPLSYRLGYSNNNCLNTGCVQGGIGYWQKFKIDFPEKFMQMADREHRYTTLKGKPVTICKDQGKDKGLVFLMPHKDYPNVKDISMIKGRMAEPLVECNGFCGTKIDAK